MSKIAHVITGMLSVVVLVLCSTSLTDSHGVMKMISENKDLKTIAGNVKLHSLMGYPYGFGVFKDQYENGWQDKRNPTDHPAHFVKALSCDKHTRLGTALKGCVCICLFLSTAAVVISFFGVLTTSRCTGILAVTINVMLVGFFMLAVGITAELYSGSFPCGMFKKDVNITLKDYFDLGAIVIVLLMGLISAVTNILVHIYFNSINKNDQEDVKECPLECA